MLFYVFCYTAKQEHNDMNNPNVERIMNDRYVNCESLSTPPIVFLFFVASAPPSPAPLLYFISGV